MGKITGFLELARLEPKKRPAAERVKDYREFELPVLQPELSQQGARCMDCGIPFCNTGCPLENLIPEWNDAVYRDRPSEALAALHATNNFPEFTGRVCPAPCEAACVLQIDRVPVAIKLIERSIIDRAFDEGRVLPQVAQKKTGKSVAIVGSGPAGLAAAQQLARAGHDVVVYERDDRIGGLLTYGIPDFKLEKSLVERRLEQLRAEGVRFEVGVHVGRDVTGPALRERHHALLLGMGARVGRELAVPGRELGGVHLAMDFLEQQNRRVAGDTIPEADAILATGKHVIVIGGGDTGSDCIGTSHRQGALSVTNLELMPRPPDEPSPNTPWPAWPLMLRSSSSHEEGGVREFAVSTTHLSGEGGRVKRLHAVRVRFEAGKLVPEPGTELALPADLVLLAMGFTGPEPGGVIEQLGLRLDGRGNVAADDRYATSEPGVFAAGDCRRGQSLVVWAIAEGRRAAREIDRFLMGHTELP